jgi:hypothetical protein
MKTLLALLRPIVAALCAATMFAAQASATPVLAAGEEGVELVAAADCYAIGQQIAAQNGATLAKASQANQGGQPVCVIVVLVPGKDGQRPRRQEFVIPQN